MEINCTGCGGRHLHPGGRFCKKRPVGAHRLSVVTDSMENLSDEDCRKEILGAHASAPEHGGEEYVTFLEDRPGTYTEG